MAKSAAYRRTYRDPRRAVARYNDEEEAAAANQRVTSTLEEATRRINELADTYARRQEVDAAYRSRQRTYRGDYIIENAYGGRIGYVVPRGIGNRRRWEAQGNMGHGSQTGFRTIKEAVAWLVANS